MKSSPFSRVKIIILFVSLWQPRKEPLKHFHWSWLAVDDETIKWRNLLYALKKKMHEARREAFNSLNDICRSWFPSEAIEKFMCDEMIKIAVFPRLQKWWNFSINNRVRASECRGGVRRWMWIANFMKLYSFSLSPRQSSQFGMLMHSKLSPIIGWLIE